MSERSELVGRYNRQDAELKALRAQVYDTVTKIISLCEDGKSHAGEKTLQALKDIAAHANYLKGFAT